MQPVNKQPALGWQIAKKLSWLNNKNYRLNKSGFSLCNKCKIAVKPTIYHNSAASKVFLRKS